MFIKKLITSPFTRVKMRLIKSLSNVENDV